MFRTKRIAFAAIVVLSLSAGASAGDKTAADAAQRRDILDLLARVQTTFDNGDAKGLAACWMPEGDFIGPAGNSAQGREAIEKLFQGDMAAHKDRKLNLHLRRFRTVNDGLVLVDAAAEVKPASAGEEATMAALVIVRQEGHWLIASARDTLAREPEEKNHLEALAWLVGQWASPTSPAGMTLHSSCDWTANRAFLIRRFKVEGKEAMLQGGTEVIGWDPRTRSIRSWVFDSDGGFGDSTWVRDGDRWLVKFSGSLADGRPVSATHVLAKVDADTATLESKDRTMGGTAQADVPQITLKRQAAPATSALPPAPVPMALRPGTKVEDAGLGASDNNDVWSEIHPKK